MRRKIYMKKLVAISVLLAILTAAVFAQDEGKWNVGFKAQLARNLFFATKTSGEGSVTYSGTGAPDNESYKLGDNIKGSSAFWTYTDGRRPDNRLQVSLSNSGEFYSVYLGLTLDNSWINGDLRLFDILNSKDHDDWYFTGSTAELGGPLVIDGKVGTGRYGGFVPVYEIWDDYLQDGGWNFFGVQKAGGLLSSNNISSVAFGVDNPWSSVYALGLTFGDIRFAAGSTLGSFNSAPNADNGVASASSIAAGFMLSGRNLGPLAFDLFYAVNGQDKNTVLRGTGSWQNLIGVYFGINAIENLGLSIGYTVNFTAFEKGREMDGTTEKTVEYVSPIYSGIDIKLSYSGIDKVGLTFNNNLSFSGAEGSEVKDPWDKHVVGLDEDNTSYLGKDAKESWFAWYARLGMSFSVSDNLSIGLALGNRLTITTTNNKEVDDTVPATPITTTTTNSTTRNELKASIHADYSVGSVSFGLGLNLGLAGDSIDNKDETSGGGVSGSKTIKGSINTVKFGIPVFFKVSL
jgi:hypothetical protein